jgi:hypothetical protein
LPYAFFLTFFYLSGLLTVIRSLSPGRRLISGSAFLPASMPRLGLGREGENKALTVRLLWGDNPIARAEGAAHAYGVG